MRTLACHCGNLLVLPSSANSPNSSTPLNPAIPHADVKDECESTHVKIGFRQPLARSSKVGTALNGNDANLQEQHDVWLHSHGALLEDTRCNLVPRENEGVAAYCRRATQLLSDLSNANRDVTKVSMVGVVLEGLEQGRPKCAVVILQGQQGGLTGRETVSDIQPDLVRLDVEMNMSLYCGRRAAAAQPSAQQALEADVERLSVQLWVLQSQAGAASQSGQPSGARPQPRELCHRFGAADHMLKECPPPKRRGAFADQGMLRSSPAAVFSSRWMVDSGCSDDIHHGGSLGKRAFIAYRRFNQPPAVHLAKKGAHTCRSWVWGTWRYVSAQG
jgi:hypothetical protein